MAYDKHDWKPNELITEALLDHMEQGIYDAYNRAERSIDDILKESPELKLELKKRIQDFVFEIDEENKKLILKLVDSGDNT